MKTVVSFWFLVFGSRPIRAFFRLTTKNYQLKTSFERRIYE